ncbi:MAG: hypothetical protein ACYCYO_00415 [Bacilli bacterium]
MANEIEHLAEDLHFHIDHAPPEEVLSVFRVLSIDRLLTTAEISDTLSTVYGFNMQKDKTYSPRRLFDLGLARQSRVKGKPGIVYNLTELGERLQKILATSEELALEILHYLHLTGYRGLPTDRKLFWSYRKCCELLWLSGKVLTSGELASNIQSEIQDKFPNVDFTVSRGYRFNSGSAAEVISWIRAMNPNPINMSSKEIEYRIVEGHELALLSLSDLYIERGYAYGDPVLLNTDLLRRLSQVFFMSEASFYDLLHTAAIVTSTVKFSDTLAGPSVRLMEPIDLMSL